MSKLDRLLSAARDLEAVFVELDEARATSPRNDPAIWLAELRLQQARCALHEAVHEAVEECTPDASGEEG
jgi:hypothetical protein